MTWFWRIAHDVICGLLFLSAVLCVAYANQVFRDIVADINRAIREDQGISLSGFVQHRLFEILAEYRRLYPDGKLIRKFRVWNAIGYACFLGSLAYWILSGVGTAGYISR
jgi:hypothetical protein